MVPNTVNWAIFSRHYHINRGRLTLGIGSDALVGADVPTFVVAHEAAKSTALGLLDAVLWLELPMFRDAKTCK